MARLNRLIGLARTVLESQSQSQSTGRPPQAPGGGEASLRATLTSAAAAAVRARSGQTPAPGPSRPAPAPDDAAAVARYDYLMRTATPDQIEQVHAEAFARLTPAQRDEVLLRMRDALPPSEQPASPAAGELARAAARSEAREPGLVHRILGGPARGIATTAAVAGTAGVAGGLLASVAGAAVLGGVAAPLLAQATAIGVDLESLTSLDTAGIAEQATGAATDALGAPLDGLAGVTEGVSGIAQQLSDLAGSLDPRNLF
ncbi:hypothetical protein CHO01_20980 [Cellulomonas hominis]|uniref:Cation-transporting ATPase n=1 Tax=Cellulomonas hominis TaxID=156981 RepID=A0A511FCS5_9CELL|nr:cation-transporting ATPase [Cellulomonas hominis]MBB5472887.1 hypothetical protein [Cellulomonas hominis]NKY05703.1 cation-transporting ATPase [Cellulomonas hominis]GEL46982.1 hypothetical protein CHO01_20980 [Cellulomonas hominis]